MGDDHKSYEGKTHRASAQVSNVRMVSITVVCTLSIVGLVAVAYWLGTRSADSVKDSANENHTIRNGSTPQTSVTTTNTSSNANLAIVNATPDNGQLQIAINRAIRLSLARMETTETNSRKRKVVFGDVNDDGNEDAIVMYAWDFSSTGGNGWGTNLSIFKNQGGLYEWISDEEVGGKSSRTFRLVGVRDGVIIGETMSTPPPTVVACYDEGIDCIKRRVRYVLKGTKLIEK